MARASGFKDFLAAHPGVTAQVVCALARPVAWRGDASGGEAGRRREDPQERRKIRPENLDGACVVTRWPTCVVFVIERSEQTFPGADPWGWRGQALGWAGVKGMSRPAAAKTGGEVSALGRKDACELAHWPPRAGRARAAGDGGQRPVCQRSSPTAPNAILCDPLFRAEAAHA